MTIPLPWTFSKDDPAGPDLEDRLQENFDKLAQQFPVGIQQVSQVPQARVYNTVALAIPNAANTALTFNTDRWDTASLHDTAVNTNRLTCNIPGLWQITGHVAWALAAGGTFRYCAIKVNGTTFLAEDTKQPSATHGSQTSLTTEYRLVAGDYAELIVQQDSGGALNVAATANSSPEFSMHWVSP